MQTKTPPIPTDFERIIIMVGPNQEVFLTDMNVVHEIHRGYPDGGSLRKDADALSLISDGALWLYDDFVRVNEGLLEDALTFDLRTDTITIHLDHFFPELWDYVATAVHGEVHRIN